MSETTKNLKNFSVLLPDTGANQISFFVINKLNEMFKENPEIDALVFYENKHKSCLPANFATMEISQAWSHKGPMIATSFGTAEKLLGFPCERKLFYIWDLSWIRNSRGVNAYESYEHVYTNKSLELIARNESHKKAIENCFNREVKHIVSDFNIEKIMEILWEN